MKKSISVFLIALLLIMMTVSSANAKSVLVYPDWTVTYDFGDETGYMIDLCDTADSEVVIPDLLGSNKVTGISSYAFLNNHTMQTVQFGNYIRAVESFAFLNVSSLQHIVFNPAVTEINGNAFSGTTSLVSMNLEDTAIRTVKEYTFMGSGVCEIAFPSTCEVIENHAFAECCRLSKVMIPESVTTIGDLAFRGCDNLVIYCTADSYAHSYAEEKQISYVLTDAPVEVAYMVGDADGDGSITILDATKIQRLLVSLVTDDEGMIALRGDSNGDGLDILDATRIQRYLAGFTVDVPIGEMVTTTL